MHSSDLSEQSAQLSLTFVLLIEIGNPELQLKCVSFEQYFSSDRSLQSKLKSQLLSNSIVSICLESQTKYQEHLSTSLLQSRYKFFTNLYVFEYLMYFLLMYLNDVFLVAISSVGLFMGSILWALFYGYNCCNQIYP